jgi:hypothetical protein
MGMRGALSPAGPQTASDNQTTIAFVNLMTLTNSVPTGRGSLRYRIAPR